MISTKMHPNASFGKNIAIQIVTSEERHARHLSNLIKIDPNTYKREGFGRKAEPKRVVNVKLEEGNKIFVDGPINNIRMLFHNIATSFEGIPNFFRDNQKENIAKIREISKDPEKNSFITLA